MFRSYAAVIALTLSTVSAAFANTAVDDVTDGAFASRDADGDGHISADEATDFAALAFFSMDSNEDARITLAEFQDWDLGFDHLASANDRSEQMASTKKAIFAQADADNDARVSMMELKVHVSRDFADADADGDGQLTRIEASTGSPWVVSLVRAAQP